MHICFSDIDHFNKVQSICFDKLMNSEENILIAAPTGAGKTIIALLTILKLL